MPDVEVLIIFERYNVYFGVTSKLMDSHTLWFISSYSVPFSLTDAVYP